MLLAPGYGDFEFRPRPKLLAIWPPECYEQDADENEPVYVLLHSMTTPEIVLTTDRQQNRVATLGFETRLEFFEVLRSLFVEDRQTLGFRVAFPNLVGMKGVRFNVYEDKALGPKSANSSRWSDTTEQQLQSGVFRANRPIIKPSANLLVVLKAMGEGALYKEDIPDGWVAREDDLNELDGQDQGAPDPSSQIHQEHSRRVNGTSLPIGQSSISSRRPDYRVEIPREHLPEEEYWNCENRVLKYDILQRLSYISRQITFELGQCLWRDSIVHFSDSKHFIAFFQDRPQIWQHVKCISIDLYWRSEERTTTSLSQLLEISDFASSHLELRAFCIRLHTGLSFPELLRKFRKLSKWSRALTRLTAQEVLVHMPGFFLTSQSDKDSIRKQIYEHWFQQVPE